MLNLIAIIFTQLFNYNKNDLTYLNIYVVWVWARDPSTDHKSDKIIQTNTPREEIAIKFNSKELVVFDSKLMLKALNGILVSTLKINLMHRVFFFVARCSATCQLCPSVLLLMLICVTTASHHAPAVIVFVIVTVKRNLAIL